ncbi:MAG: hypothetical protein NC489_28385 [Ruminococcus flavefaciens]|nr:hypothetical protein [Ruminococcus flavefaciens]
MEENMRITREQMIASVIGAQYSIDDQIAILRQKDAKPEEYEAFYAFAEEVKKKVGEEYAAYAAEEEAAAKAAAKSKK